MARNFYVSSFRKDGVFPAPFFGLLAFLTQIDESCVVTFSFLSSKLMLHYCFNQ